MNLRGQLRRRFVVVDHQQHGRVMSLILLATSFAICKSYPACYPVFLTLLLVLGRRVATCFASRALSIVLPRPAIKGKGAARPLRFAPCMSGRQRRFYLVRHPSGLLQNPVLHVRFQPARGMRPKFDRWRELADLDPVVDR